jgi:L-serine dehydratase
MSSKSIFNDVLGPIMRGPSSSHTAGSYNIAKIVRNLKDTSIKSAKFKFDPNGSYAPTYKILGVDKAFATGILGLSLIDKDFDKSLDICHQKNISLIFKIEPIAGEHHPNTTLIELLYSDDTRLSILAESIGGGRINIKGINYWDVSINGLDHQICVETVKQKQEKITSYLQSTGCSLLDKKESKNTILLIFLGEHSANKINYDYLKKIDDKIKIWSIAPIFSAIKGKEIFTNSNDIIEMENDYNHSIGNIALNYEMELLGITEKVARNEMDKRLQIMIDSVKNGFDKNNISMPLTEPSAKKVMDSEMSENLAIGGIYARAAARAMATMHIDNSMGIVCAAPTGGSSGVLPGIITTLIEEKKIDRKKAVEILYAASAIGILIAKRATFSAELAGCQVEIGASGAMAAAAIVEFAGGDAIQALNAAAIALQNTMGSVCDTVQGGCEIPCHTRNALGTSNAFLCADLVLGGYQNPISLDETIDAMYEVGKAMPVELRCTSRGGIAISPSAIALKNKNK